ncbi:MAG: hypothetical protein ACSLE6_16580 [Mycobacterium sp.]
MMIPWSSDLNLFGGGNTALIVLLVLATLFAVASIFVPLMVRYGTISSGAGRLSTLIAGGPYVTLIVVVVTCDVVTSFHIFDRPAELGPGVGPGALLGVVGITLALRPRAWDFAPAPRRWRGRAHGPRVLVAAVALTGISALVSVIAAAVSDAPAQAVLATILMAGIAPLVNVIAAIGMRRDPDAWRLTVFVFGAALVIASFALAFTRTAGIEQFGGGWYYALFAWVLVAAMSVHHGGLVHVWPVPARAARNVLSLIAVWSIGYGIASAGLGVLGLTAMSDGAITVQAVFALLAGAAALIGSRGVNPYGFPPTAVRTGTIVCVIVVGATALRLIILGAITPQSF